jgi:Leucine-rich repeat (LRR) protein
LEIESNFFTGALPFLSDMPELRQIYLRRNALNAHLNFIKSQNSWNIKELWLDGNAISQNIPSQIGKLTNLESLSIADAQLTGTLPTEMGYLTNLRRVWLSNNQLSGKVPSELQKLSQLELFKVHQNQLSGSIPDGVCQNVVASEYDHKAVMADCDKVDCSCCAECGA